MITRKKLYNVLSSGMLIFLVIFIIFVFIGYGVLVIQSESLCVTTPIWYRIGIVIGGIISVSLLGITVLYRFLSNKNKI